MPEGHVVLLNGQKSGREFDGGRTNLVFSPDGTRLAYRVWNKGKYHAVVDGKWGEPFDDVRGLTFSPNTARFGYLARNGKQECVVIDGLKGEDFDQVWPLRFSPDGQRIAFRARRDKSVFAYVDGIRDKSFSFVREIIFGPFGRRVAYVAIINGKFFVVRDGVRIDGPCDWVRYLSFDHTGSSLRYVAGRRGSCYLILEGVKQKLLDTPYYLTFGPRGVQVAYNVQYGYRGGSVLVGEVTQWHGPLSEPPVFSPNGKRCAYVGPDLERKRWSVILNGARVDAPTFANSLSFSPDGKRLAYRVCRAGTQFIMVDGERGEEVDWVLTRIKFSADSKQVAYGALKGRELWWQVMNLK